MSLKTEKMSILCIEKKKRVEEDEERKVVVCS